MKQYLMSKIANKIITQNLKMQANEDLLIVTEASKETIAESLAAAALAHGVEPMIMYMTPRDSDSAEPPHVVAEAMKAADAFLSVVEISITHSDAVKQALAAGPRGLVLTQLSEDMMYKGGMEADFEKLKPVCIAVSKALEEAKNIRVTTPFGTDLTFNTEGRRGNALYCIVEKGQFSTAPTVEANTTPIEGSAEGIIVADASFPYLGIGLLDEPIILKVEKGNVVSVEGGRQADILREDWASKNDPGVYNIAELGIGLNPACRFRGLMLEDEGVYGSCHIGIGTSANLGGELRAASHYDAILTKMTITCDGIDIMRDGVLTMEGVSL